VRAAFIESFSSGTWVGKGSARSPAAMEIRQVTDAVEEEMDYVRRHKHTHQEAHQPQ
jgi:hypothetical protein